VPLHPCLQGYLAHTKTPPPRTLPLHGEMKGTARRADLRSSDYIWICQLNAQGSLNYLQMCRACCGTNVRLLLRVACIDL